MQKYEKMQLQIEGVSQQMDMLKEKYSDLSGLDQVFSEVKKDFE